MFSDEQPEFTTSDFVSVVYHERDRRYGGSTGKIQHIRVVQSVGLMEFQTIGDHSPRLWNNASPVVVIVWYDQKIGSLMVMLLALLMNKTKRMTNMPPVLAIWLLA